MTTTMPARRTTGPEDARPRPPRQPDGPLFQEPAAPPTPPASPPTPPALPAATLREAYPHLRRPFPQSMIDLKPSATTRDKARALCVAYVDLRAYQRRLDQVVGPDGWSVEYVLADRGLACRLTLLGVTKSALGDYPSDRGDENPATSAEAQAFKRACSAFGLGRYLYALPMVWAEYDADKRQITGDHRLIVGQMYAALPAMEE